MTTIEKLDPKEFEQVIYCRDSEAGLNAIIAIHDTTLGPGVGGIRMYPYPSEEMALNDVLRLAKGMTYKAAISGLAFGGAKSVIIGDPEKNKTEKLLKRFADFVNDLKGQYICAKDVGIHAADLRMLHSKTKYILGVGGAKNSSGDPSPATAFGVLQGIRAIAQKVLGRASLDGLSFAIQGVGAVGHYIAQDLQSEGARLSICDVDQRALECCLEKFNAHVVHPDKIYDVKCDFFVPCAMGAVLNSETIPRLKCRVVAGSANNQLATFNDGLALARRGIFYAPDYVINAGGLINIAEELGGYHREKAFDHVAKIYHAMINIIKRSEEEKEPPFMMADRIAREIVANKKKRINPELKRKSSGKQFLHI